MTVKGWYSIVASAAFALSMAGASASSAATPPSAFSLSVVGAEDNAVLPLKRAAKGECGGDNISPPITWQNAPTGTTSFAVVMSDPDGRDGLGIVQWIRYGLPATLDHLDEGAGSDAASPGRGGKNVLGATVYHGPCPPLGERPHHYVIQIYALNLPPEALPIGLGREVLNHAMLGHILGATSVIQRFGR